jgi:uncharacterized membrane protein
MNRRNFLICGLTGWCIEIIFTSIKCLHRRDGRLIGQTSLWMFPIYGMAVLIEPIHRKIGRFPMLLRGVLYSLGIFSCEYISGSILKKHALCPWDYSDAKANIHGVIRLDFAPYWIATGLLFEKILCKSRDSCA